MFTNKKLTQPLVNVYILKYLLVFDVSLLFKSFIVFAFKQKKQPDLLTVQIFQLIILRTKNIYANNLQIHALTIHKKNPKISYIHTMFSYIDSTSYRLQPAPHFQNRR